MSKKSFKDSARKSVASAFFGELEENTEDTLSTLDTQDTTSTPTVQASLPAVEVKPQETTKKTVPTVEPEQPYYRINLKLKGEYKDYLDQVSWENRTSITAYLNDLIETDMRKYNKNKK